jgi:hypothetical protein
LTVQAPRPGDLLEAPREGRLTKMSTTSESSSAEQPAPYGSGPSGAATPTRKVRVHHLRELKERGEPWPMLTAYDMYTAELFDEAGIPVLLVGDSAANNVRSNVRWSSPTCRSAPTSSPPSRHSRLRCGS